MNKSEFLLNLDIALIKVKLLDKNTSNEEIELVETYIKTLQDFIQKIKGKENV